MIDEVKREAHSNLVVITGGEPFRQPIERLCERLEELGFVVQLETNGTIFRKLPDSVQIVCSPKSVNSVYCRPHVDLLPHISALKFLISASEKNYDHVPELGQSEFQIPVYLQPMDQMDEAKNSENLKLTLELVYRFGYKLSLQIHKIIGVR